MSFEPADDWRSALTWMIMPIGRSWQRAAGAALSRTGQSLSSAATILVIARLGDGVRQRDVADEADIDPAAIARSVVQLEGEGLVSRQTDAQDTRAKLLSLTPAGRALARDMNAILEEFRSNIFNTVSDEDGQAAVRVLMAIETATASAPVS